ncbi:MAG TPA: VOC family protein [Chloroflexota bacterium]|jgi:catechol 2,3-dioxygenase-like lactoylglutathione lyase family enzyme|nr:VOC family protein [Chloroflexota bacterium]
MVAVRGIDHIVLTVADIDRSLAFYHGLLGLPVERLAEFRAGQVGFPSLRVDERFVIDLFPRRDGAAPAGRNMDHFCLVVEADALEPLVETLRQHGVPILGEPMPRWGAQGTTLSVYVLDPDGNQVELRSYAPALRAEAERRVAAPRR